MMKLDDFTRLKNLAIKRGRARYKGAGHLVTPEVKQAMIAYEALAIIAGNHNEANEMVMLANLIMSSLEEAAS